MPARALTLLFLVLAGCNGGTGPTVTLEPPAYLRGLAKISVGAMRGDEALARATLESGAAVGTCAVAAVGFDCTLDTTLLPDGAATLTATVFDKSGASAHATAESIVDNGAPTVSLAAPVDGAVVGGRIAIEAIASDATSGIAQLELSFEGTSLGVATAAGGAGLFTLDWDASALAGPGRLAAVATDGAGNTASTEIQVDVDNTPRAAVTGVDSPSADRSYGTGESIDVAVSFSRAVVVVGTPALTLETGVTDRDATYVSGSGTTTLVFRYQVAAGDASLDLDYASASALAGTVRDEKGRDAILTLAAPGSAGSLGAARALVVDALGPTVTQVSATTPDGAYRAGQTIDVTVTFSEPVTLDGGAPTLTLETGASDRAAAYLSGSGTATFTFRYVVQAGDNSADLDVAGADAFALAGAPPLHDSLGNTASLTLPSPGAPGSLGANKQVVVDTTAPGIVSITSTTPNGAYGTGAVIDVRVIFSEPVVVTGNPTLPLDSDGTATYVSTSSSTVIFTYTVGATQVSFDLDAFDPVLGGATIKDPAGNDANLDPPPGGMALYENKNLVVDTVGPVVELVDTPQADGLYGPPSAITVKVYFGEPVFVTGGAPTLTMETGAVDRIAIYSGGSGTDTLEFTYTVQAGDYSPDLDYASVSALASGGATLVDNLGNPATLTLPVPGLGNTDSLSGNANLFIDDDPLGVRPAFPVAPQWNDYYLTANPTLACSDNDNGRDACRHGGERRRVVTNETSCAGLSMSDALGVFDWSCAVESGKAVFVSTLKRQMGLRHLVDAAAWKNNSVTLTGGAGGSSLSRRWWANPVAPAPAGVSLNYLDQLGQIYTVAANRTGNFRVWMARKVALVVFEGVTLALADTVNLDNTRYAWLEGQFNIGNVCTGVVGIGQTNVSQLRQVTTLGCCGDAIALYNSSRGNRLTQIRSTIPSGCQFALNVDATSSGNTIQGYAGSGGNSGVVRLMSDDNLITDFTLANNTQAGITIQGGQRNILANGRIFNNTSYGVLFVSARNSVVSQVVASNNNRGISNADSFPGSHNTLSGITVTNGGNIGVYLKSEPHDVVFSAAIANHGSNLRFESASGTAAQLAAAHHYGIDLALVSDTFKFTGNLLLPSPAPGVCFDNGSANLKFDCSNDGISDANLVRADVIAADFVGKVTSDSVNPDGGASGSATYAFGLAWLDFQNLYRAWGKEGSAFPAIDHLDRCGSGTCRIWDWSLRSSATVIRNTTLTPGPSPSPNPAFADGAACPTDGTQLLESASYPYDASYRAGLNGFDVAAGGPCVATKTCKQRFLKAALETIADQIGDDDGLCESNEACLYMPNFGAYQGSGTLGKCNFSDGTITGVQLSGYLVNGE